MKLYTTLFILLCGSALLAQKDNPFFSTPKLFIHEGKLANQVFLFNTDGTFYFAKVSAGPYRRSYGCYKRKKDRIFLTSSLNKNLLDFVVDKKEVATQDSFHILSAFDSTFRLNYCHSILINGEDTLTYNIFQNKWTPLKKKKIKYFQLISNTTDAISRRYKPSKKDSNCLYTIAVFWEDFNSYVGIFRSKDIKILY